MVVLEVGEEGSRVFSLCRDPGRGCHQEGPVSPAEPQQSPDSHQALDTSAPVSQLQRPSPGPPAKTTRASSWGVEAEKGFPKADAERHPDLRLGPLCCPETRTLEAPPSFRLAPLSPPRSLLGSTWPTGTEKPGRRCPAGSGESPLSPAIACPGSPTSAGLGRDRPPAEPCFTQIPGGEGALAGTLGTARWLLP